MKITTKQPTETKRSPELRSAIESYSTTKFLQSTIIKPVPGILGCQILINRTFPDKKLRLEI